MPEAPSGVQPGRSTEERDRSAYPDAGPDIGGLSAQDLPGGAGYRRTVTTMPPGGTGDG
jgi:hypothetical protein